MTTQRLDPQGQYPARPWYPYVGPRYLLGPPVAPPAPAVSLVFGDMRPRGSWLRGFDYGRLVELLAEGWYEQDQPREGTQE